MANEKHIFIGIGGQGVKTVAQVKEKVYEKRFSEATKTKSRLDAMNDSYRFLFLDTDQRDIDEANKRNRSTFEHGKVPFISPQTDLINLGRANPHAIWYEAKQNPDNLINKRILEACSEELHAKIPDQPLSFGAGAFRIKSRIAFAHALADFQSKLQAAISSLNDVKTVGGEDCIIYYWLVSSSLGGTGSGIFNDVLYHINQLHHQIVGNGDPQLVYTMYMPKVFIDCNNTEEKYSLNAYGVFSELEAFKVMSFEEKQNTVMHRLAFNNDYNLVDANRRYCPFYYLIPIDIQTDKGTSLGTPHTMVRNTAEMLYHLHNGQAGATFRSDIDNYMNDIMERNHKEFLVPMGYVSLQKPNEQFNKYMRFRLRRDILEKWLLCETGKDAQVSEEKEAVKALENDLFKQLVPADNTIATKVHKLFEEVEGIVDNIQGKTLNSAAGFGSIESAMDGIKTAVANHSKGEKLEEYKQIISEDIWKRVEIWVFDHGLTYAYKALDTLWHEMNQKFNEEANSLKKREKDLTDARNDAEAAYADADNVTLIEKTVGSNEGDVEKYKSLLSTYVAKFKEFETDNWGHEIKKSFCGEENNDVLSKIKQHIASFKDKAAEMTKTANKQFDKLASDLGMASMDVTTVYLPQLTTICDGNGWLKDNLFSRLYSSVFLLDNNEPERKELKDFLKAIYQPTNPEVKKEIKNGKYYVTVKSEDPKTHQVTQTEPTRYFSNPTLDRSDEKVIDDFLTLAVQVLEKKIGETKVIQEKWSNKKISSFFEDLTNEVKDEVRRSLNPALFFSYNSNRIEVMKKEEHIVFVAGNEDLAKEMLGFQKGNPKHRFEKAADDDTALVLKSKYGLALSDYRIYDSIKMVYDKATFREKYHFHHDFAQFLDKITIEDLPDEILPQHRAYAKMLLLDSFKDDMKDFFYVDYEYDAENYSNSLIDGEPGIKSYFNIALPEAFRINQFDGKLILLKSENGRKLYHEIEGKDFEEQFAEYRDGFYNYRYGATVDAVLQTLLRQSFSLNDVTITGEQVFKDNFERHQKELLKMLSDRKKSEKKTSVQRLYNILFNIVREDYDTVHKFIK